MGLRALLCPPGGRTLPGWRTLSILCRCAHIVAIGMLLGGYGAPLLGLPAGAVTPAGLHPWWLAAGASGLALIALELYKSCAVLGQLHMWAAGLKLLLVGALFHGGVQSPWAWIAVAVAAGYISHAPGKLRHYPEPGPHSPPPCPPR